MKDRKGTENQVADHLSRLESENEGDNSVPIQESFPDKQLLVVNQALLPLYADLVNYLVSGKIPPNMKS